MDETATIQARVAAARQRLKDAGIPDAEADLDARLMAQWLLGWDAARFLTSAHEEPGPPSFPSRYDELVQRRARREPMAYLLGRQEFWGLVFEVTPAVLIPRPETELIVETALTLFPDRVAALEIADVGTGCGCLAIVIAVEYPAARIVACDVSDDALLVARLNASRHGVVSRIGFGHCDLLPDEIFTLQRFDLIVSNPPYVPEDDRETLQPEVRDHEPAAALFAGEDGLAVIRKLVPKAAGRLKDGAFLVFEFGFGQETAVAGLISQTPGLTMVGLKRDLQGIPRVAVARRHNG